MSKERITCTSTHCERAQECRSPGECTGSAKHDKPAVSDAEVEAMIRRQQARAFNRSEPSVDLGAKEVASMFRALLRDLQAVPARIAAAVQDALAGAANHLRNWPVADEATLADECAAAIDAFARSYPLSTDHLAAQLAAAEARGRVAERKSCAAILDGYIQNRMDTEDEDEKNLLENVRDDILALALIPPAGGANDAV